MRKLPKRKRLLAAVTKRLATETATIAAAPVPKSEADRIYGNARGAVWFRPVVKALQKMAGKGERCMLCSGSESSDVEHFRPKADFPLLAMTWENYLWACTLCNRRKLNQFPLDAAGEALFVNPVDDNVWDFFYIDKFGNLTPNWDKTLQDFNVRGKETMEKMGLDRQPLQETRKSRLDDLKEKVNDTLSLLNKNRLTVEKARRRIAKWLKQPFQPDVADYFLNGPGKTEQPFKKLFKLLQ